MKTLESNKQRTINIIRGEQMKPNSRNRPKNRKKDLKHKEGKDWGCSDTYHKQARKQLKEQLNQEEL